VLKVALVAAEEGGAAETANFAVLEQVGRMSLSCSPPIPSFRPRGQRRSGQRKRRLREWFRPLRCSPLGSLPL